jgi:hypothetical protein
MAIDYTLFYREQYKNISEFSRSNSWNLFISAYNNSDRVRHIFDSVNSDNKHWLILPEYGYRTDEYPNGDVFAFPELLTESDFILQYINSSHVDLSNISFCIDITGFMRSHLIFLIKFLKDIGIKKFDAIYTDPMMYGEKEKTSFTIDAVEEVRQIIGCEGIANPDMSNDILIIGSGYDNKLISNVAERKDKARKIQLFGFPSLKADMYQENLLRANKAEDSLGGARTLSLFAPANDPFVTASVLSDFVNSENRIKQISNLYLSPLSTKAQTLGFVLYYVWECIEKNASIIFPFTNTYNRETTIGVSKIWKYTLELPN